MKPLELPLGGQCRCGQVRFQVSAPPLMTSACHCIGCQKMTGSAYSLTAMIPAGGFAIVQGTAVVGGTHGPQQDHMFCPHCMSWIFTRITGIDDFVNVRPTLCDDTSWCAPFIDTMTAEKLPWAQTPAQYHFAGFPPPDQYGPLMAAFAKAE